MNKIELRIFGQGARILTNDPDVLRVIAACYSAFLTPIKLSDNAPIELTLRRKRSGTGWSVTDDSGTMDCEDLGELIFVVEKSLTIELQLRRPDLYFLHAAAISSKGRCILISGESGAGKSTLCWDLCNSGLTYMSDELAPLSLDTMRTEAYPHAICLKQITGDMPALPKETIRTESTMHVPVEAIPGGVEQTPATVDMIVFLEKSGCHAKPRLTEMPQSEAAARFYSNGLNQLAHERDGLRAATKLAAEVDCFTLARGSLGDMRRILMHRLGL